MRADELRTAVNRITLILDKADVRSAVDRFRSARGDERTVAAARLGHAGAIIMERFEQLTPAERRVVKHLHLDSLASPSYWDSLIASAGKPGPVDGEIVRLASRVMYASSHLPGLIALLDESESGAQQHYAQAPTEGRLIVRLADAGERATDPDRVARSIDGVDMLYSACASIARKPAIDLRLEGISGDETRDIHFTGDKDATAAATAVLQSIPDAIAAFDDSEDLDLDDIIASLPVFEDLQTLASLGSFTPTDLKDITETMYQGAMLALESGVSLVTTGKPSSNGATPPARSTPVPRSNAVVAVPSAGYPDDDLDTPMLTTPQADATLNGAAGADAANGSAVDHYNRYLQEREAMQQTSPPAAQSTGISGNAANGQIMNDGDFQHPHFDAAESSQRDSLRKDAVDELLQALGKRRTKG